MSATAQVWALHQAQTENATQRLVLYRISSAHANEDHEAQLDLDDLIRYTGEEESTVRNALNDLARLGYITRIAPAQGQPKASTARNDGPRVFDCHIMYNADDEYKF